MGTLQLLADILQQDKTYQSTWAYGVLIVLC
jgi:hypothetical protein